MAQTLLLVACGLAAGVLSGMFGIGGGVVIVPMLVLILGHGQQTASGTSLVALLLPVGLLGVMAYYRAGKIGPAEVRAGLTIAVGLFAGAFAGARLAIGMSDVTLRRAFAVFLVLVAAKLWFQR